MLLPETKKLLQELGQTQFGRALSNYLEEKLSEINDVTTIKTFDETLGRQHAVKLIDELFGFMGDKKVTKKRTSQYE